MWRGGSGEGFTFMLKFLPATLHAIWTQKQSGEYFSFGVHGRPALWEDDLNDV